jgi:hypothetical protein
MDRARWTRARAEAKPSLHRKSDTFFSLVGGLVGAVVVFVLWSHSWPVFVGVFVGGLIGFVGSINWESWLYYRREPMELLRAQVTSIEGRLKNSDTGSVSTQPNIPTLEISPKTRGIVAHLLDEASERVPGTLPGFIYVRTAFHVSAGHDNQHPVTVLRARGTIRLDDDIPSEIDGELMFWFDEMVRSDERGDGPPVIPPGHTATLSFSFTVLAKPAESGDPEWWNYHIPTSSSIELQVFDAQNTPYPAREAIGFEVASLLESL